MCAQYWPATAGTMMKYGDFMVSTVSINDTKDVATEHMKRHADDRCTIYHIIIARIAVPFMWSSLRLAPIIINEL